MTSIMVEPGDWGERRLAAREAASRRRERLTVVTMTTFGVGLPFAAGVIDGITGRQGGMPDWTRVAMIAAWIVGGTYVGWSGWRDADEVQRGMLVSAAAAAGGVGFLAFPVLGIVGPWLGIADAGEAAWTLSGAAALLTYVRRRGW